MKYSQEIFCEILLVSRKRKQVKVKVTDRKFETMVCCGDDIIHPSPASTLVVIGSLYRYKNSLSNDWVSLLATLNKQIWTAKITYNQSCKAMGNILHTTDTEGSHACDNIKI